MGTKGIFSHEQCALAWAQDWYKWCPLWPPRKRRRMLPCGPMQGVGLERRMTWAEWPHEEWLLQATRRFPISECLVQRFK